MKYLIYLIALIAIVSCKENEIEYSEFDFVLNGFEWDSDPYKFNSVIRDSILKVSGPQRAAWDYSYVGNIEMMHRAWDTHSKPRSGITQELKDSFARFEPVGAIEFILKRAESHTVVIINEGHHMPQHRVFTTQLLEGLMKQGYTSLGLETYFASPKTDSLIRTNGYPTLQSGYYTKEPQFGNLLRVAHKMGFKIFGYESEGHANGKEREINQAKNIQKYLERNPNEKVLIHCGFDHGYEGDLNNKWEKAMAGRLTEFTGINPLTINQVKYSEKSKVEYENVYYQLTNVDKPSVFVNEANEVFGEQRANAWFDISVFHPRSRSYNRPSWMVYGNRREVDYTFEDADIACPCLVFAYKYGEEIGSAIPYDIQESQKKSVKLVLDDSSYNIVIWNQEGKALLSKY